MLEFGARAVPVLAAAWVVTRFMRYAPAAARHLVWQGAMLGVLAMPLLASLAPRFAVPVPDLLEARWNTPAPPVLVASDPASDAPPSIQRHEGGARVARWVRTASWVGTGLTALWFALGWAAAWRAARRSTPAPPAWQLEVEELRKRLQISADVRVRLGERPGSPMVIGLHRPVILLPRFADSWSRGRREVVFAHELAHVRRHDCRTQLLSHTACALYWFNPLIWVAAAGLRRERERACDDEVLRLGTLPSAYAQHLLEIARTASTARGLSPALTMARPSELEGRLLAILAPGPRKVVSRRSRLNVAAILAATTAVALGATPSAESVAGQSRAAMASPGRGTAGEEGPLTSDAARERLGRTEAVAPEPPTGSEARAHAASMLARLADAGIAAMFDAARPGDGAKSAKARETAALKLAVTPGPDVVPALLEALDDSSSQVREKAAIGLAFRRDPRVVTPLIAALHDADSHVRQKAAIALGTSGDPRARAPLTEALVDRDPQVREKAAAALALLGLFR